MARIHLIAHNIRSAHNVGSLFRTADGLDVTKVYLSGYTPYPRAKTDKRLPHIAAKVERRIAKTSLGAEKTVNWQLVDDLPRLIGELKSAGTLIAGLEQAANATKLSDFKNSQNVALIIGSEVGGIEPELLRSCDVILEIPMAGRKDSFNVSVAAAIALYHLRFIA